MKRRDFIKLLGGAAAAWPIGARAQQRTKVWRIGFLAGAPRPVSSDFNPYAGFLRGMRELGYVEGRDFIVEWRFAEGRYELFPDLAAELVRMNVDVIVSGTSVAVPALQRATATIPIVMGASSDPVGYGFVGSLANPGGNTTGLATSGEENVSKQLQLLTMAAPNVMRIGMAVNPGNPTHGGSRLELANSAATSAGRVLLPVEISTPEQVASAFARWIKDQVGALMVPGDPFFFSQRKRFADLALSSRLPTIFGQREYAEAGGLMSYGESLADFYRRAAFYVDKLLKGAKPAELPIQQPTRFFLVINRKTAEKIGVELALPLLVAADEVIE